MENKSIGKVTVGYGTKEQKEIEVACFVRASFKDHRLATISELEDGSIVGAIENPESSGRNTQAKIWLTEESFLSLVATYYVYCMKRGKDLEKLLTEIALKNDIEYEFASID